MPLDNDISKRDLIKFYRTFGFRRMETYDGSHLIREVECGNIPSTMKFYGMSSKTAQEKYNNGLSDYKASEGKTVKVPYRGPVSETIKEILGGLRSCGTYIGAKKLKDFSKCATFVKTTVQENKIFSN
jgi:IMP dehydrogenase/GMP reductase